MTDKNELAKVEPTVEMLVAKYVESGKPIEEAGKLFELFEKMQALKARQDFNKALRKFQKECPPVVQRSENAQFKVTRKGHTRPSTYASLDDIATTIRDPLDSNGLSYRWGDAIMSGEHPNKEMSVPCILSHDGGHTESSSFPIPVESKAGSSKQQQWASASTYARRYSLVQALGLTTTEHDNDGNAVQPPPQQAKKDTEHKPTEMITLTEIDSLNDVLIQKGRNKDRMLAHYQVKSLAEMTSVQYKLAMAEIMNR